MKTYAAADVAKMPRVQVGDSVRLREFQCFLLVILVGVLEVEFAQSAHSQQQKRFPQSRQQLPKLNLSSLQKNLQNNVLCLEKSDYKTHQDE